MLSRDFGPYGMLRTTVCLVLQIFPSMLTDTLLVTRSYTWLYFPCHHTNDHRHQRLYSPSGPWPTLTQFRNEILRHTVGLLGQVFSLSQGLNLHRTTQRRSQGQTSMPQPEFGPLSSIQALRPCGHYSNCGHTSHLQHYGDKTCRSASVRRKSGLYSTNLLPTNINIKQIKTLSYIL
jgi:hypothetical protein